MTFIGIVRGKVLDANLMNLFVIALGVKTVKRRLFPSDPVTKENRPLRRKISPFFWLAMSDHKTSRIVFKLSMWRSIECLMLITWISGILLTQIKCIDYANCHANDSAQHDSDFRRLVKMSIALIRWLTTQRKESQETNCCLVYWIEYGRENTTS